MIYTAFFITYLFISVCQTAPVTHSAPPPASAPATAPQQKPSRPPPPSGSVSILIHFDLQHREMSGCCQTVWSDCFKMAYCILPKEMKQNEMK